VSLLYALSVSLVFVFKARDPEKVGFYITRCGVPSSQVFAFQKDGSRVLGKDILGFKLTKSLSSFQKDLYTLQREKKLLTMIHFLSKNSKKRKGSSLFPIFNREN
jgi:hypothetical protein